MILLIIKGCKIIIYEKKNAALTCVRINIASPIHKLEKDEKENKLCRKFSFHTCFYR